MGEDGAEKRWVQGARSFGAPTMAVIVSARLLAGTWVML